MQHLYHYIHILFYNYFPRPLTAKIFQNFRPILLCSKLWYIAPIPFSYWRAISGLHPPSSPSLVLSAPLLPPPLRPDTPSLFASFFLIYTVLILWSPSMSSSVDIPWMWMMNLSLALFDPLLIPISEFPLIAACLCDYDPSHPLSIPSSSSSGLSLSFSWFLPHLLFIPVSSSLNSSFILSSSLPHLFLVPPSSSFDPFLIFSWFLPHPLWSLPRPFLIPPSSSWSLPHLLLIATSPLDPFLVLS